MLELDSIYLTFSVDYQALATNVQLCPSPKHIPCSRIYLPYVLLNFCRDEATTEWTLLVELPSPTFRYGIVAVCMKAAISSVYLTPLVGYRSGRDDFGAGRF